MSTNCSCKNCCNPCYNPCNPCNDPCVLLVEPCNPCPPCPQTISYCVPAPPCPQPCPQPCAPSNSLCPQYVVYNQILPSTTTSLTGAQVNSYNMFVFNTGSIPTSVSLPVISTLNNGGKKIITITNTTTYSAGIVTITPGAGDSLNGAVSYSIDQYKSVTLTSLVGITASGGGTVWAVVGN